MLWDIFHSDRLELERAVSTETIQLGLKSGSLYEDDLVRPAGTTNPWARIGDFPELVKPPKVAAPAKAADAVLPEARSQKSALAPKKRGDFEDQADAAASSASPFAPTIASPEWVAVGMDPDDITFPVIREREAPSSSEPLSQAIPAAKRPEPPAWIWEDDDDEGDEDEDQAEDEPVHGGSDASSSKPMLDDDAGDVITSDPPLVGAPVELEIVSSASHTALPVVGSRDSRPLSVDDATDEEQFSLSRSGPMTVEELDLAPMVDVALQLVLFFMVTATTVLYKSLEIPKPSTEPPPAAVTQGRSRTLDDLKDDFILVEIDANNAVKVDREQVAADREKLVERLTAARQKLPRNAILLSTDYRTLHRFAVMACDAANEIGLQIKVAAPAPPQAAKAPGLLAASTKKAASG